MNKLYGLYYIEDVGSYRQLLCCSNSHSKLREVCPFTVWRGRGYETEWIWTKDVLLSGEESFPFYSIKELPYVC